MIKKLSFISIFLLCFFTVSVNAQEATGPSPTRDNALGQRVNERIQRLKTDLDTGELQALISSCKPAQNKLNAIQKAAKAYSSGQGKRIDNIASNLNKLSESLRNEGRDTSQVEQALDEINQLKSQVDNTYENYLIALKDSAGIDCEANPEGFRSSVDDAKKQFSELADFRKALKDLIKVELRESLTNIRAGL